MYDLSKGANYNTDHYLVAAKVRERLAVSKKAAQKFDVERFHLRKLRGLEVRKKYHIKISNRLASLENLSDSEDINRARETLKRLSQPQLKQHKPWFDEECS